MTQAQIGTVIAGTLLLRDLITAFADELERLSADDRTAEEKTLLDDVGDHEFLTWTELESEEVGSELVDELITALDRRAPGGAYFGAHPGDGADFGFWGPEGEMPEAGEAEPLPAPIGEPDLDRGEDR